MRFRTMLGVLSLALPLNFAAVSQNAEQKPELLLYHPAAPLSYEVDTIKPIDSKTADSMVRLPPGATLNPLSIRRYIMDAYGAIYQAQVVGGPDWLDKDSYQINAKPPADLEAAIRNLTVTEAMNQKRAMQQSLLADRFHLSVHFETRVLSVYELVPAKGGLKITAVPAPPERKAGDPPPLPPTPPQPGKPTPQPPPGTSMTMTVNANGLRTIKASAINMASLARTIRFSVTTELEPRPIVDHTGFTGYFDIKDLTFAPLSTSTADNSDALSLQRALEEQLGIKLQPARAPIEVLVIDHIERPSEN